MVFHKVPSLEISIIHFFLSLLFLINIKEKVQGCTEGNTFEIHLKIDHDLLILHKKYQRPL